MTLFSLAHVLTKSHNLSTLSEKNKFQLATFGPFALSVGVDGHAPIAVTQAGNLNILFRATMDESL